MPIVVYISDTTPAVGLDGRWVAGWPRIFSGSGQNINVPNSPVTTTDIYSAFKITQMQREDLGANDTWKLTFETTADATAFVNDIAYVAFGTSNTGTASNIDDLAVDPVWLDISEVSQSNNAVTWDQNDTNINTWFSALVSGDFVYMVAYTTGNAPTSGIVSAPTVSSTTPTVNDTITLTPNYAKAASTPDWYKWTITGVENTDWQYVNSTNRYSVSPEIQVLTTTSFNVSVLLRWEGTSNGATTYTETASTTTTISPVASETVYLTFDKAEDSATALNTSNGWWLANSAYTMTNNTGVSINYPNATYPRLRKASDGARNYLIPDIYFTSEVNDRDVFLNGLPIKTRNSLVTRFNVTNADGSPNVINEVDVLSKSFGYLKTAYAAQNTFDPAQAGGNAGNQLRLSVMDGAWAIDPDDNAAGEGAGIGWDADMGMKIEVVYQGPISIHEDDFVGASANLNNRTPDTASVHNRNWIESSTGTYQTDGLGALTAKASTDTGWCGLVMGDCDSYVITAVTEANSTTSGDTADSTHGIVFYRNGTQFERIVIEWVSSQYNIKHLYWNGSSYTTNATVQTGISFSDDSTPVTWEVTCVPGTSNISYTCTQGGSSIASGTITSAGGNPNFVGYYQRFVEASTKCTNFKVE